MVAPAAAVALRARETAALAVLVCGPGLSNDRAATLHCTLWLVDWLPSPAVTVTVYGLDEAAPAASVPEITPVALLMLSPVGRPLALKVMVSPLGPVAWALTDTVCPAVLHCAAGACKTRPGGVAVAGAGATVQVELWVAAA